MPKSARTLMLLAILIVSANSFAVGMGPSSITYEGFLTDTSDNPLSGTQYLRVEVLAGSNLCRLYEEHRSVVVNNGNLSLRIGESGRTYPASFATAKGFAEIFDNSASGIATNSSGPCGSMYVPTSNDIRKVRVHLCDATYSACVSMGDMALTSAPHAMVADTLNGKKSDEFVQTNGTVTQVSVNDLVNNIAIPFTSVTTGQALRKNASGQVEGYDPTNGANLANNSVGWPKLASVPAPLNQIGGLTCTMGQILKMGSSSWTCGSDATGGGGVTSVTASGPLQSSGGVTPDISLAAGSISGQVLRWNGSIWTASTPNYADLKNSAASSPWPSTSCAAGEFITWSSVSDGFQCTALTYSNVVSKLGYAPLNPASNLSDIVSPSNARTNLGLGTAAIFNAGTGANNLVQLDGTGKIPGALFSASINMGGFDVSNVGYISQAANRYIRVGAFTATPSLPAGEKGALWFDDTTKDIRYWDGALTKTLGISGAPVIASTANLADGKVWIGDGTNKAQERSVSGDATINNTGVMSVDKIKGHPVSASTPASSQILVSNGAQYNPVTLNGAASMTSAGTVTLSATGVGAATYRSVTVGIDGRISAGTNPTTVAGYAITDAIVNTASTPSIGAGLDASKGAFGTAGRLWIASDSKKIYRDSGSAWVVVGSTDAADLTGTMATAQLPTVPQSKGGTGLTTAGSGHQVLAMNAAGTAMEYKTLVAGSNVVITPSTNTLTIDAAASSAAGANTQIQYNNAGAFAGSSNMTWNNGTKTFTVGGASGVITTTGTNSLIQASGTGATIQSPQFRSNGTGSAAAPVYTHDIATNTGMFFPNTAAEIALSASGTEGLRVLANGNVGIGTTGPGDKLQVQGKIRAQHVCYTDGTNCKDLSLAWPTGTVTTVSTGNGLTGGPITVGGTIAVDTGTGPGKIVQLDGSSRLPAVDGSQLSSVNAMKLNGTTITAGTPSLPGQVLRYDGTNYSVGKLRLGDIQNTLQTGSAFGVSCNELQTLTYNAVLDQFSCVDIRFNTNAAMTFYVRSTGSDSACNGQVNAAVGAAPACAFATLQRAVDAIPLNARHKVTITVEDGMHFTGTGHRPVMSIAKFGSYMNDSDFGGSPALIHIKPVSAGPIYIDGSANSQVGVLVHGAANNVLLEGFTFTNFNVSDSAGKSEALVAVGGSALLNNTNFIDNLTAITARDGGMVRFTAGPTTINLGVGTGRTGIKVYGGTVGKDVNLTINLGSGSSNQTALSIEKGSFENEGGILTLNGASTGSSYSLLSISPSGSFKSSANVLMNNFYNSNSRPVNVDGGSFSSSGMGADRIKFQNNGTTTVIQCSNGAFCRVDGELEFTDLTGASLASVIHGSTFTMARSFYSGGATLSGNFPVFDVSDRSALVLEESSGTSTFAWAGTGFPTLARATKQSVISMNMGLNVNFNSSASAQLFEVADNSSFIWEPFSSGPPLPFSVTGTGGSKLIWAHNQSTVRLSRASGTTNLNWTLLSNGILLENQSFLEVAGSGSWTLNLSSFPGNPVVLDGSSRFKNNVTSFNNSGTSCPSGMAQTGLGNCIETADHGSAMTYYGAMSSCRNEGLKLCSMEELNGACLVASTSWSAVNHWSQNISTTASYGYQVGTCNTSGLSSVVTALLTSSLVFRCCTR